jgi:hypothetical protein
MENTTQLRQRVKNCTHMWFEKRVDGFDWMKSWQMTVVCKDCGKVKVVTKK